MPKKFGILPTGEQASLYTISCGPLRACVTDYGAHLVSLFVPDRRGCMADVVLGFDDANGYRTGNGSFLGAIAGRNTNRVRGASFLLEDTRIRLAPNDDEHNLHSGPDYFHLRMWKLLRHTEHSLTLRLESPQGDQGYPGRAVIDVTYTLEPTHTLRISYDACSDRDTVMNLTSHSYFNLAGHDRTDRAMDQVLTVPGRFFLPNDVENIPTGELRSVAGTPMDFRQGKPIGRDIEESYEPLHFQGGFDHNYEVFADPCAILADPGSGREMAVSTDCPGLQVYAGNYLNETGKGSVRYTPRSGVALQTQFFPDAVHHPQWLQPIIKAGEKYHSETAFRFSW